MYDNYTVYNEKSFRLPAFSDEEIKSDDFKDKLFSHTLLYRHPVWDNTKPMNGIWRASEIIIRDCKAVEKLEGENEKRNMSFYISLFTNLQGCIENLTADIRSKRGFIGRDFFNWYNRCYTAFGQSLNAKTTISDKSLKTVQRDVNDTILSLISRCRNDTQTETIAKDIKKLRKILSVYADTDRLLNLYINDTSELYIRLFEFKRSYAQ